MDATVPKQRVVDKQDLNSRDEQMMTNRHKASGIFITLMRSLSPFHTHVTQTQVHIQKGGTNEVKTAEDLYTQG